MGIKYQNKPKAHENSYVLFLFLLLVLFSIMSFTYLIYFEKQKKVNIMFCTIF